jgi:acetylglutamate kinase
MALSGLANKRLVAALVARGVPAVGVSGEDDGLLDARVAHDGLLGRVGAPHHADVSLLRHLVAGGFVPVVSPVARDGTREDGAALNVNGDDAAAALAAALGAGELVLVSDVAGVRVGGATAPSLDADAARAAIASGEAAGGMAAKLEAALLALDAGVPRVRVGDLTALSNPGAGTCITLSASLV